jgi:hypothetical protein
MRGILVSMFLVVCAGGVLRGQVIRFDRSTAALPNPDPYPAELKYLNSAAWQKTIPADVAPSVQAGREAFADYFKCELGADARINMPVQDKEKILLVRFPATCAGTASEVYLWDEPFLSTYFVRLPKGLLAEPDRAADLIPQVASIATPDQHDCAGRCIHSIRFTAFQDSDGCIRLAKSQPAEWSYRIHQIAIDYHDTITIWVHEDDAATWLSYTLGKSLVKKHYPPGMVNVTERFPPLRLRLQEMPRASLLKQILGTNPRSWSDETAEIWVHEAILRDLSVPEYIELFRVYGSRLVEATIHSGLAFQYRPALAEILPMLKRGPDTGMVFDVLTVYSLGRMLKPLHDPRLTLDALRELNATQ